MNGIGHAKVGAVLEDVLVEEQRVGILSVSRAGRDRLVASADGVPDQRRFGITGEPALDLAGDRADDGSLELPEGLVLQDRRGQERPT